MKTERYTRCFLLILALLLMLSGLSSCLGDDACKSNRVVRMKINFLKSASASAKDTALQNLSIYGLDNHILFLDSVKTTGLNIPLDATADSVAMVMITEEGNDTIQLKYTRELFMLSVECGFITRFHLTDAILRGQSADSVIIENTLVIPNGPVNLNIYY